jgi:hypothetical protein
MPLDNTSWSPDAQVDETTALLVRARGFLERGWCRNTFALDTAGNDVSPESSQAVMWCANGALRAAGLPWDDTYRAHPAILRLKAVIGGEIVGLFNNRQESVEPVLAAFDRAIAAGSAASNRSAPAERAIATRSSS